MLIKVLWIYLGVWICFVIGIFQGSEYASDTQLSEYAYKLLNNALIRLNMAEAEPKIKITVQAK